MDRSDIIVDLFSAADYPIGSFRACWVCMLCGLDTFANDRDAEAFQEKRSRDEVDWQEGKADSRTLEWHENYQVFRMGKSLSWTTE